MAVNNALRYEFFIGRENLAVACISMCRGDFKKLISKDVSSKLQWLDSIWIARDK